MQSVKANTKDTVGFILTMRNVNDVEGFKTWLKANRFILTMRNVNN